MQLVNKLSNHDLVVGLPRIKFEMDKVCDACQMGKQTQTSSKSKNYISMSRHVEIIAHEFV